MSDREAQLEAENEALRTKTLNLRDEVRGLRDERDYLRDRERALTVARDKALADYRFMVERAADEKLDGYRELAARAAAAENARDESERTLRTVREAVAALEQEASALPLGAVERHPDLAGASSYGVRMFVVKWAKRALLGPVKR